MVNKIEAGEALESQSSLSENEAHAGLVEPQRRGIVQSALVILCGYCVLSSNSAKALTFDDDDGFRIGGSPNQRWRMIGQMQAQRTLDRDALYVRADRAYSAIRIRVLNAPMEFFNVQIHFRNGGSREINVRQWIERGGATRIINLPGEKRLISRIVFWYKTPPLAGQRSMVQVWART
ncbi:hypothetical protein [Candidatus Phycosocius spiralis]|uniref:Uncharacterized protein n=1 Tax=Candidatus Phycosocius spiralis TaxID=2815099 RepID=A0ABQ4PW73_9PROT|nr:hypothetical protein [Candidatus Phycosocius spiralis]GIU67301.1 hypothetical protein PsB1_1455 [Candidatus Phycosocius spiralis]